LVIRGYSVGWSIVGGQVEHSRLDLIEVLVIRLAVEWQSAPALLSNHLHQDSLACSQFRGRISRMCTNCFLVPPLVLARLAANHPDPSVRASATRTLAQDRELRTARTNAQQLANSHPTGTSATNAPTPSTLPSFAPRQFSPQRTIYTAQNRNDLRATEQLRTEGHLPLLIHQQTLPTTRSVSHTGTLPMFTVVIHSTGLAHHS
jgi:hypothetical protein